MCFVYDLSKRVMCVYITSVAAISFSFIRHLIYQDIYAMDTVLDIYYQILNFKARLFLYSKKLLICTIAFGYTLKNHPTWHTVDLKMKTLTRKEACRALNLLLIQNPSNGKKMKSSPPLCSKVLEGIDSAYKGNY